MTNRRKNRSSIGRLFQKRQMVFALIGAASIASIGGATSALAAANESAALTYDSASRSPVPIPPPELGLQTVTAEPWLNISDQGHIAEGLSFDRDGNLLFIEIPTDRVKKIAPDKTVTTLISKSGVGANGLAIHKDGRIFIGGRHGIRAFSHDGTKSTVIVSPSVHEVNDLAFDSVGGIYFTDPRGISTDPIGGVYYVPPDFKSIKTVLPKLALANGVAINPNGKMLWVAEYSRSLLHRVRISGGGDLGPFPTSIPYRFTGAGPDTVRVDNDGNVYVAVVSQGRIMVFNRNGIPIGQILLPGRENGRFLISTSLAIKPGTNEVYIVASDDGESPGRATIIFRAYGFTNGMEPYSHQ